jgi:Rieske 2Fe-2S family protein
MTDVREEPTRMLAAESYTSTEVLDWERRHLFAASWTCLGRPEDLLPTTGPKPVTQRSVMVGDIACVVVRDEAAVDGLRMFPNTCRHRGHELLSQDDTSTRRSIQCPYHAWTYDLAGSLIGAPGFRDDPAFDPSEHSLAELPVRVWHGWVFAHALHPLGSTSVPSF